MRVRAVLVLVAAGLVLTGCLGDVKRPAPIREAGKHPAARPAPPRPTPPPATPPGPPSAQPLKPAPPGHYRVQPGDNLFRIAFQHGLDYPDLARWNNLADPDHLLAGSVLRLTPPPGTTPPVAPASEPLVSWDWPARGPILRGFGEAGGNKGLDIAGTRGSPIRAAAAGQVLYASDGLRGYGKLIIIKHSESLLSAYAHQDAILVREGDQVARGQMVGRMGDSDTQQVMLHFEIREHGKPVDPRKYLPN